MLVSHKFGLALELALVPEHLLADLGTEWVAGVGVSKETGDAKHDPLYSH